VRGENFGLGFVGLVESAKICIREDTRWIREPYSRKFLHLVFKLWHQILNLALKGTEHLVQPREPVRSVAILHLLLPPRAESVNTPTIIRLRLSLFGSWVLTTRQPSTPCTLARP
jgi:hypothetical protein